MLLRGLARGSRHWGEFAHHLQEQLPGDRVVCVDLAGNGRRHQERSPLTADDAVSDLREQLREQGLQPPYHVIALSLGGMLTLNWLVHDDSAIADEVASAVVINTSHGKYNPVYHRMRPVALQRLLMALWLPVSMRESIVYQLTVNTRGHRKRRTTIREWIAIQRQNPVSVQNFYRQIKLAGSFSKPLKIEPRRCLLLASTQDRLVNPKCSQKLANRFGLSVGYHSKAGHDMTFDDPDWVAKRALQHFFGDAAGE
ncbi:2-succinyl-6-hydroxy-2,4-cyclohexadiene-1-carboxylate synthase [BD1-7 clade bacterium]|uniref:2-succinyl-6-hydroxy-2,4-cyclohexadiene-1-carboxy late synthase n=1 Tax=BD1-7 clade bacterium TaxID=2029982 RepID=A0A5S9N3V3_9GAMM|nr:2-succinyl-6-hydroxy-2,4-cyclohexadiene-1-carboxylate synthase [BD1-7 clade bacterium]